jgi:hypothetical protein
VRNESADNIFQDPFNANTGSFIGKIDFNSAIGNISDHMT